MGSAPALRIAELIAGPQRVTGSRSVDAQLLVERLEDSLLGNLTPFLCDMIKKVTLYFHDMCGGCQELKPILKKTARSKGWKYTEKNIEKCKTKLCEDVEYVPTLVVDGKKLSENEMYAFIDKEL